MILIELAERTVPAFIEEINTSRDDQIITEFIGRFCAKQPVAMIDALDPDSLKHQAALVHGS